jgi:peptidoglycan/xylan/chitin deacetylase (PgdA/CDA1 family)
MKNVLKNAFFVVLECCGVNALFRHLNRGRIKVLMFHSISKSGLYFNNSVSESGFVHQLKYLSKYYSILKLSQEGNVSGYDPQKVNVLLTFDDGFIDNYTTAAPILAQSGLSGVYFVLGECLLNGSTPQFIKSRFGQLSTNEAYSTFMTKEARKMIEMGMTIGSHGQQHLDYSKIPFDDGLKDASDAKTNIENEIGMPVALFAFPWGKFQERHLDELKTVYQRIFTTQHGFNNPDDFVFYRNEIANTPHLWCATSGALDFFIRVFRRTVEMDLNKTHKTQGMN